jgi:peroxiredoxin
MTATVGAPAPAFTLKDTGKNEVSLGDFKGRKTLLVFIPFPFTGTCEFELCTIRDNLSHLGDLDANVVAISCDTLHANRVWSEQQGFGVPLLSDFWPHGEVCRAYGAFNETTGSANRMTFVLDEDGVVKEIIDSGSLGVAREFDRYTEALAAV